MAANASQPAASPSDEPAAFETLVAELDEEQRRRLELGLSAAEGIDGIGPTRWRRYEAMALEYLSSHGDVLAAWDDAQAATAPRSPDRERGPALDPAEERRKTKAQKNDIADRDTVRALVTRMERLGMTRSDWRWRMLTRLRPVTIRAGVIRSINASSSSPVKR